MGHGREKGMVQRGLFYNRPGAGKLAGSWQLLAGQVVSRALGDPGRHQQPPHPHSTPDTPLCSWSTDWPFDSGSTTDLL